MKSQEQNAKSRFLIYPRSASASSLPRLGLYLSFFVCFLFSTRFTGGGVPSTARDAAFTALVAVNFLSFFFFGTTAIETHSSIISTENSALNPYGATACPTHSDRTIARAANRYLSIPIYLVYTLSASVAMSLLIPLNGSRWVGVSVDLLQAETRVFRTMGQSRS